MEGVWKLKKAERGWEATTETGIWGFWAGSLPFSAPTPSLHKDHSPLSSTADRSGRVEQIYIGYLFTEHVVKKTTTSSALQISKQMVNAELIR